MLKLDLMRTDGGNQIRELDQRVVDRYARLLARGVNLRAAIAFHDGTDHWLGDGGHRKAAARKIGMDEYPTDIREGTVRDAILYAIEANNHGTGLTQKERNGAAEKLLRDEEWGKTMSDAEIARRCQLSPSGVAYIRRKVSPQTAGMEREVTRNGKTYKMKPPSGKPKAGVYATVVVTEQVRAHVKAVVAPDAVVAVFCSRERVCEAHTLLKRWEFTPTHLLAVAKVKEWAEGTFLVAGARGTAEVPLPEGVIARKAAIIAHLQQGEGPRAVFTRWTDTDYGPGWVKLDERGEPAAAPPIIDCSQRKVYDAYPGEPV
jgi:hypothetical protein